MALNLAESRTAVGSPWAVFQIPKRRGSTPQRDRFHKGVRYDWGDYMHNCHVLKYTYVLAGLSGGESQQNHGKD